MIADQPEVTKHPKTTLLITGLGRGGAEIQLTRLALALHNRGWPVQVITITPAHGYASDLETAGIPVISLGIIRGKTDPRVLFALVRELRRHRTRLLVTFLYHANVIGRIAGRLASVTVIVSSIRNEYFGGSYRDAKSMRVRIREFLERFTIPFGTMVTTNSQLAAKSLIRRRVVSSKRIRVIPNGISVSLIESHEHDRNAVRTEWGVKEDEFVWIAVGRLERQKNYSGLLRTFAEYRIQNKQSRLVVVGDGVLMHPLTSLARDLGLEQQVMFLGMRKDVPRLLWGADAAVLASEWEGLPNSLMEAHAARLPVVATRVGGIEEIVLDRASGFIVLPSDKHSLAHAMKELTNLPKDQRYAFGKTGCEHVRRLYDLERVMDRWEELLIELTEKH